MAVRKCSLCGKPVDPLYFCECVFSTPPAPQETAGEAQFRKHDGPINTDDLERWDTGCKPTPAAAPTDNTALVEAAKSLLAAADNGGLAPLFGELQDAADLAWGDDRELVVMQAVKEGLAALASRPAEATSREGVEVPTDIEMAMKYKLERDQLIAKLAEVEHKRRMEEELGTEARHERNALQKQVDTLQAQVTEARAAGMREAAKIARDWWDGCEAETPHQLIEAAILTPTVSDAAQEGDKV